MTAGDRALPAAIVSPDGAQMSESARRGDPKDQGHDPMKSRALPEPLFVNGVQQHPIEGVSMAYAFNDAKAAERHETQYFEMAF